MPEIWFTNAVTATLSNGEDDPNGPFVAVMVSRFLNDPSAGEAIGDLVVYFQGPDSIEGAGGAATRVATVPMVAGGYIVDARGVGSIVRVGLRGTTAQRQISGLVAPSPGIAVPLLLMRFPALDPAGPLSDTPPFYVITGGAIAAGGQAPVGWSGSAPVHPSSPYLGFAPA